MCGLEERSLITIIIFLPDTIISSESNRGGTTGYKYFIYFRSVLNPLESVCSFFPDESSILQIDIFDFPVALAIVADLWTGEDFPVYFEYEISPLNYELPIMVPNNKGHFFGWLPWHYEGERKTRHATSVSDKGWMAEFFIPFKLLSPLPQVPPKPGTEWRANMYRIDYDQGQTLFSWQKTTRTFHEYNQFGTFIFN